MKIKCQYCEAYFDDTNSNCPHCGAPNAGVVRTTKTQPLTIADLEQWYKDRKLPPYETTRFFIGIDYRQPKAFGIYKDESTGNFVVYKNKASGERAVRYEGTDEAYAVNELFQRLKQEIIEQKKHQAQKAAGNSKKKGSSVNNSRSSRARNSTLSSFGRFFRGCLITILSFVGFFILVGIIAIAAANIPKQGYYNFDNKIWYYSEEEYYHYLDNWFDYEDDEWNGPYSKSDVPEELQKKKTRKKCFLGEQWDSSFGCENFADTLYAADLAVGFYPDDGYYKSGDNTYYHLWGGYDEDWYIFDGEWKEAAYETLSEEFAHPSTIAPLFVSEEYDSDFGVTDFKETIFYKDSVASTTINKGYYTHDNKYYYHLYNYYDDGWYAYDDTAGEWRETDYDYLPEDLQHPSMVQDFYTTETWDAETQITDFEDTTYYEDYIDSQTSYDDDDDDGWTNWDNDDDYDWDTGTDWDTDLDTGGWDDDW